MNDTKLGRVTDMVWGKIAVCGLLAGTLAACSHDAQTGTGVSAMWRDLEIEVVGTLVSTGGCGLVVDSEGRRYGVVGDLSRYERGDRLRISGPVSYWSACGTYSAIKAERVDRAPIGSQSVGKL